MQPIKTKYLTLLFLGAMVTGIAIFGFNFFAVGYSLSDLTTFFLAKDSRVQERLVFQVGTNTGASIVVGTQSTTFLGNPDDATLPRIELDGSDGKWKFKNRNNGTTSTEISTLTQDLVDSLYIKQNNGTGSNTILTNPTHNNGTISGSVDLTATLSAGGASISPIEISAVDNASGNFQTQIDAKLPRIGTTTTYLQYAMADGKTGTTSVEFQNGIDFTFNSVLSADGKLTIQGNVMGSASAKADLKDDGSTEVNQAAFINFVSPLTLALNGLGGDIGLDDTIVGTQTPGIDKIVRSDSNGKIDNWISPRITFIGTTSVFTVPTGITTIYVTLCGGGGGGGPRGDSNNYGGGGGGSAHCFVDYPLAVIPGATHTASIGVGGAKGIMGVSAGGNGGDSTFGASLLVAKGGKGGAKGDSVGASAGAGGTSLNGGFNGESGENGQEGSGGDGAKCIFGAYVDGVDGPGTSASSISYGSGGSGGRTGNGGDGRPGFCIIKY